MKTLLVTTDEDVSALKKGATVVGVADSVEKARDMLNRKDLDLVVLDKDLLTLLSKLSNKEQEYVPITGFVGEKPKKSKATLVAEVIGKLGLPPNLCGYTFIQEALMILLDSDRTLALTKEVYPEVKRRLDLGTAYQVERGIRHMIQTRWDKIDKSIKKEVFGEGYGGSLLYPTSGEFLHLIIEYIKRKM